MRLRRHCENHDDQSQPDIAFGSWIYFGFDDGDGDAIEREYSRGGNVAIYGDGHGELEYGGDVDN